MKKLLMCLCCLAMLIGISLVAEAEDVPETIKIGLYYNSTAKPEVDISCDGDVIVYYDGEEVLRHADLAVKADEEGLIKILSGEEELYTCDDGELKFASDEGFIRLNDKPYRGSLELINLKNGKMTVVNKVGIEEYLYGVVPFEMSTGFPMEALKSQAVCARNYAITNMGRFSQYGFDLTDNTLSQVYGGASKEAEDCTRAVDETKGMLVMYEGKPAQTFYFATSSGHTLNVKDVWGSNLPYLVGADDSLQEKVKTDNAPWKVPYTKDEMQEKLEKMGVFIGKVVDVEIESKSPEGAVTKLKFIGTEGEKIIEREKTRTVLNLKSQCYDIEKPASSSFSVMSAEGVSKIKKTVVIGASGMSEVQSFSTISADGAGRYEPTILGDEYIFIGSGNGHGLGMSQNGAKAMALEGYTFEEILTHYFTGTEVK